MGFIRIIFIALLIWYGVKLIIRFILPLIIGSCYVKNQKENTPKEGEVIIHIDKKHQQNIEEKEKKGDYVDYEEIE